MNDSGLSRLAAATVMASFAGPSVPDWLRRRIDGGLGGVCLFGSNLARPGLSGLEATARVAAELHAVDPGFVVALDEESGAVTRIEAAVGSSLPGNAALGAVDDVALTRSVAVALGATLAAVGVDLDLAPSVDVNVDAANPVIGVRSFGADPDLVARHGVAFVAGLQSAGVAACAKHFPGHGATAVDSHLALPEVDVSLRVLEGRELLPFRFVVAAGVAAVMTGHLRVPTLDPDDPATVSPTIISGVLREQLGFDGLVVTDALDMDGIGGSAAIPANVVRAVAAGVDFCCLGSNGTDELVGACIDALVGAVSSGALDEDRLADAAGRLAKLRALATRAGDAGVAGVALGDLASIGADAARRALRVEGVVPRDLQGAHVVELRRAEMIAAGAVPWGIAAPLAALDPTATSARVNDPSGVPAALDEAIGRPLVVVVRDPQTNPATAKTMDELLAARPDAVLVDMGWPPPLPDASVPPAGARITTYGPSRVSADAAARLLTGLDSPRSASG